MLTLLEQTVENCCRELEDRLKPLIKEKETIKGEEQAVSNQTIMQIIVSDFIPKWTRMRFRLLEQEKDFVIEIYDAQGEQEMQPVTIRFKYEFDWGVESWEEAMMLCKKDRVSLYTKWKETGMTFEQIADHFNTSIPSVKSWSKHGLLSEAHSKRTGAVVKMAMTILKEVGITSYNVEALQHACKCKMGCFVPEATIHSAKKAKYVSPDMDTCLDIAILYIEDIINNIKEINKLTYSNWSLSGILAYIGFTTGISVHGKRKWDGENSRQLINHDSLEKCIDFFNNILEKLNQKRKELEAA